MGIEDRDWYRDEMRQREAARRPTRTYERPKSLRPSTSGPRQATTNSAWIWTVILLALMFVIAMLVSDMKDRGIPFTSQGLRWWLSLWWGPSAE
jgi:hypothetical protein